MATYEYRCALGHHYEETRGMDEGQRLFLCPECKEILNRVWTAPPITFKGAGFYSTHG